MFTRASAQFNRHAFDRIRVCSFLNGIHTLTLTLNHDLIFQLPEDTTLGAAALGVVERVEHVRDCGVLQVE